MPKKRSRLNHIGKNNIDFINTTLKKVITSVMMCMMSNGETASWKLKGRWV